MSRRILALLAALAATHAAHPFHGSFAQIDYISTKKSLEVIVWIHAEDFERVMKQQLGKKATLDKEKEAEKFIHAYLKDRFEIKSASGQILAHTWIAVELRTHFIAGYFECPAPEGLNGLTLTNRILIDTIPDQANQVRVKQDGKERLELTFDSRSGPGPQALAALATR